jgi:hypothetical protein
MAISIDELQLYKMLDRDALNDVVCAAADKWDSLGDLDNNPEYLRGQLELIADVIINADTGGDMEMDDRAALARRLVEFKMKQNMVTSVQATVRRALERHIDENADVHEVALTVVGDLIRSYNVTSGELDSIIDAP